MRPIKFRVWSNMLKKMFYQDDDGWAMNFDELTFGFSSIMKVEVPLSEGFGTYELMQFTGLKDKNGKEIYGGDIVKDADGDIGEIVFDDFVWSFRHYPLKGGEFTDGFGVEEYTDITLSEEDVLEVIGNIYNNPELL
jgi:uncharacterized phage protein (TIGR01671 family)